MFLPTEAGEDMSELIPYLIKEGRRNIYHTPGLICGWFLCAIFLILIKVYPFEAAAQFLWWVLALSFVFACWEWIRRIPRFTDRKKIGILFAPHGDEEVQKDIESLRSELICLLKTGKFPNLFVVKDLPENRIVKDVETAHATRQKSGCLLLIWGHYQKGKHQSKELRGFLPGKLNFTYAFPRNVSQSDMRQDIGVGIADRTFMFSSENELIEREFVNNNLFDVTRYIIGTCLTNFGFIDIGRALLEEIILKPAGTWVGRSLSVVRDFHENLKTKISRIDYARAQRIYFSRIFPNGKILRDSKGLDEITQLAQMSISNRANVPASLILAIAQFLTGNIRGAKKSMRRLMISQTSDPSPTYSLAFLCAYDGNLTESEKYYRRAFKRTLNADPEWAFHLAEFPEAVLELEPQKISLHYALGLLHQELLDKSLARKHFAQFINKARGTALSTWIQKAQGHLNALGPATA